MRKPDNSQSYPDEALEAPPRLVSALKRLPQEQMFVPPTVDEAILRAAQRHLQKATEPRWTWLRFLPWVAATAGIVLLATIPHLFKQRAPGPGREAAFAHEDFNHDGSVDILDAFALARQLKLDGPRDQRLDVNGDGVVDDRDVAALAARAVRLEPGGHS
jgi:hypothetical protein